MRQWSLHPGRRPRAHTLIELVIGSVVAAILMLAVGSTLNLMTRGAASVEKSSQLNTDAAVVAARLRREIGAAVTISSLSPTSIEFTHPDLTGEGADDVIAYDWAGSGAPLTRRVNDDDPVEMLPGVDQFGLMPFAEQKTLAGNDGNQTDEKLIASHQSRPFGYRGTFSEALATKTTWVGEQFSTSYAGTQSFEVTRVKLYLKAKTGMGNLCVSIRDLATKTTFQEMHLPVSSLSTSSFYWHELPFTNAGPLQNNRPYALVLRTDSAATEVYVGRDLYSLSSPSDGTVYVWSTTSGASWNTNPNADMRFTLYGRYTYTIPQAGPAIIRTYVKHFSIRLGLAKDDHTAVLETGTLCPNRPEITGLN